MFWMSKLLPSSVDNYLEVKQKKKKKKKKKKRKENKKNRVLFLNGYPFTIRTLKCYALVIGAALLPFIHTLFIKWL